MYIAVQKACNQNNSVWSGLPAFVTAFGEYETTIADIDTQRQIQEGKTTGITENKQKEEDEMIQATVEMAAAVYAYASKIGDSELKQKVNYTPSDLIGHAIPYLKTSAKPSMAKQTQSLLTLPTMEKQQPTSHSSKRKLTTSQPSLQSPEQPSEQEQQPQQNW